MCYELAVSGLGVPSVLILLSVILSGCDPAPRGDGRLHVGGIVFQEDQYMRLVQFGMEDAAKSMDVDLMVNNTFNSLDKEISIIDTYLANQMDAIVVTPLSTKGSIPALRHAQAKGVVVVTLDNFIEADFPVADIRSDQFDLGRKSGEAATKFISEHLGNSANIALVTSIAVSPELGSQRVAGFRDEVTKLPGVKIVTQQDAWLAPEATVLVENMLTAHPEISVIWAANEGGTVGAVTAVVNRGMAGKIVVFGTDMSEQIGRFLLSSDNVLQAVTGQKPYEIGQRALTAAVDALRGKTVEKNIVFPGVLFTRENPDEVNKYLAFLQESLQ